MIIIKPRTGDHSILITKNSKTGDHSILINKNSKTGDHSVVGSRRMFMEFRICFVLSIFPELEDFKRPFTDCNLVLSPLSYNISQASVYSKSKYRKDTRSCVICNYS